jgi:hypothetical protein
MFLRVSDCSNRGHVRVLTQVHPEPFPLCFQGFATYLPVVGLVSEEGLFELALRVKDTYQNMGCPRV